MTNKTLDLLADIVPDETHQGIRPSDQAWQFFDDPKPDRHSMPLDEIRAKKLVNDFDHYMRTHYSLDLRDQERHDKYHARMEAVRYAQWLAGWYRRNSPEHRETFMASTVALELDEESFLTQIRDGLSDRGMDNADVEQVWQRLSVYKAIRSMLTKPRIEPIIRRKTILRARYTSAMCMNHHTVFKHRWKSREVEDLTDRSALPEWSTIHRALDGHGDLSFLPRPPIGSVFLNPDGSKFATAGRSPIQAKMAYARKHKLDPDRVMVERVTFEKGSEFLRQLKFRNRLTTVYVISTRKLSDEAESSFYDPDPYFTDSVTKEGKWIKQYQWTSGHLMRWPEDTSVMPGGYHRLTVRELERAILSGATFAEDDDDIACIEYEAVETSGDDRLRSSDDLPRKDIKRLSEGERALYDALRLDWPTEAEFLLIDWDNAPPRTDGTSALEDVAATIHQTFAPVYYHTSAGVPVQANPKWDELVAPLPEWEEAYLEGFFFQLARNFGLHAESSSKAAAGRGA